MFCDQLANLVIWVAAQLYGHFIVPGMVLEMRPLMDRREGNTNH